GREAVAPDHPTIVSPQCEQFTGGIGDDDEPAAPRRAGRTEYTGDFGHAGVRPERLTGTGIDRLQPIVERRHEHLAVVDGRGAPARRAGVAPPDLLTASGVERYDLAAS